MKNDKNGTKIAMTFAIIHMCTMFAIQNQNFLSQNQWGWSQIVQFHFANTFIENVAQGIKD
jgi:hypothetical protein